MSDLYIVDFGGGEQERACREAERGVERRRLADRYASHLVTSAGLGEATARRVITALFDPRDADGSECLRLSSAPFGGARRRLRLPVHLG